MKNEIQIDEFYPEESPQSFTFPVLLRVARYAGAISLAVGWAIFFSWIFTEAFFHHRSELLMDLGALWVLVGMVLCSIGILCLVIFVIANRGKSYMNSLKPAGIILLNIPSVIIIVGLVISII